MIDINLIPPNLRKDGQGPSGLTINLPREVLLGVGSGLVLIILAVHLLLGAVWLLGFARLSIYNASWQRLMPDRTILDSINNEFKSLKKQTTMISDLTTKSVHWAPKFNAVSDALPKGLWLRKMVLDNKIGLTIEGSVISKTRNEVNLVESFLAALKQNEVFMKDFSSLEVNSIQRSKINNVEIADFTVIAKLK